MRDLLGDGLDEAIDAGLTSRGQPRPVGQARHLNGRDEQAARHAVQGQRELDDDAETEAV